MAICKRCGADDLIASDLCGNAGCIYCCGTPEENLQKKNKDSYTILLAKEKKCTLCGVKTYLVKESNTCEKCYLKTYRKAQ